MNKKLLRSVREYKKQSVLAPILVILEVLMEVLIPLEMAKIIDVGIANGSVSYVVRMGGLLLLLAIIGLTCSLTAQYFAAKAATGTATALRNNQLQQQDMRRIYDTIFFIRCRIFPLKISTTFQHQVWSHD